MAETIKEGKWHWFNVMKDLDQLGGLAGVVVDPLTMTDHGCGGQTKEGTKFYITWIPETFLLLSMTKDEQALIDAFAKVVEYRPFCRYVEKDNGLLTVEWDKKDPDGRFVDLQSKDKKDIKRIE